MAKMSKYFTSWLMHFIIMIFVGLILNLFLIEPGVSIAQIILSILFIWAISVYRELSFWKLLGFVFLVNIVLGLLLFIFILGVFL